MERGLEKEREGGGERERERERGFFKIVHNISDNGEFICLLCCWRTLKEGVGVGLAASLPVVS